MERINLQLFNGLRLLACLQVISVHVYYLGYTWTVPSDHIVLSSIHNLSILKSFLTSSIGVEIFWFLSGFICSFQLYEMGKGTIRKYCLFILNRLFRLYPIYLVMILMLYYNEYSDNSYDNCRTPYHLARALLFFDNFGQDMTVSTCSGVGWSLSIDMQTYILLIILFYVFSKTKTIIKVLKLTFLLTCLISIYVQFVNVSPIGVDHDISSIKDIGFGIEIYDPGMMKQVMVKKEYDITDPYKYIDKNVFDPNNPSEKALIFKRYYGTYFGYLYFPTYSHIGSGLLGSILCLQLLIEKENKIKYKYHNQSILLMFFYFFLHFNVYNFSHLLPNHAIFEVLHTIINGALYFKTVSLGIYFMMNILLRIDNAIINMILANKISSFLSQFTYCIYFFHTVILCILTFNDGFRKSVSSELDENGLILKHFIILFAKTVFFTFLLSIPFHYILEIHLFGSEKNTFQFVISTKRRKMIELYTNLEIDFFGLVSFRFK